MVEIMRSRLFYGRAGMMIFLTTFTPLPDGVVRVIISMAKRALDDSEENKEVLKVLTSILDQSRVASRDYFGRAWTLAVSELMTSSLFMIWYLILILLPCFRSAWLVLAGTRISTSGSALRPGSVSHA